MTGTGGTLSGSVAHGVPIAELSTALTTDVPGSTVTSIGAGLFPLPYAVAALVRPVPAH